MNVFFTNECPIQSANEHCYVHQVKMIVEYAQLLSTAHHVIDGDNAINGIYKQTHTNHPSAVWVRKSADNYEWVWECAMQLCELYKQRTGKTHATEDKLWILKSAPSGLDCFGFTKPPVAAPDEFKAIAVFGGACKAYQKYLVSKFAEWQRRDRPIKVEFDNKPAWLI